MDNSLINFMETYFDEIEAKDFYRRLFGSGLLAKSEDEKEYAYHGTILDFSSCRDAVVRYSETKDKEEKRQLSEQIRMNARRIKVWDDLSALDGVMGVEHIAYISPCSYVGLRRTNDNARYFFAMAIDLDNLVDKGINNLFSQIDRAEVLPRPTYVVCSGNGLHLYYQFEEPIPCYPYNVRKLLHLKSALTYKIWNAYITKDYKSPQIEGLFQTMRVVGSGTKDGSGVARAFEVGGLVTLNYLNGFVAPEHRTGSLEDRGGMPVEFWKLVNPDWYHERIELKLPPKTWTCNRGLYDWWLNELKTGAKVGHRYYCVMVLAVCAIKSGVPYSELRKDAYSLIPLMNELSVDEENPFTAADVRAALRTYKEKYKRFPREWIERLTAIEIPENRRNGRKRADHLEMVLMSRKIKQRNGEGWKCGQKGDVVRTWRQEHPDGRKADCIRDTGLSKPTVYKYWNAEQGNQIEVVFQSFDDLTELFKRMTVEEQKEWFRTHKATVLKK